jgi:hypothetical protein
MAWNDLGKVNGFSEEVSIFHENGHEEENNSQQPQNNALLLGMIIFIYIYNF